MAARVAGIVAAVILAAMLAFTIVLAAIGQANPATGVGVTPNPMPSLQTPDPGERPVIVQ
jgi:hypothetical protein